MRTGDRFRSLITVEFKYSGTGIHIREKRIAKEVSNCEIKCYVVDDRRIKYHDEIMYMTTLAKMLTGKKVGIAGPLYFNYSGKNLQKYYDEYQAKKV